MEVEGTFKLRKQETGPIEVTFEPKDSATASKRTKRFPTYDGMVRFLTDIGVKSDKIPPAYELRPNRSLSISDVKVDRERVGA
ncbi:hypothetical protein [Nitrospira sp. Kam-Ns4a]